MVSYYGILTVILIELLNLFSPGRENALFRAPPLVHDGISETMKIDEIDFIFSLKNNNIRIEASFILPADPSCPQHITYNFDHKKKYTKTLSTFEKGIVGDNWYEINFLLEKYMFARVESIWVYAKDDLRQRVNFKLKSYDINIKSLDLVESASGYFEFNPLPNGITRIDYLLDYHIKPTRLKKYLYRIQRNESITILCDYKAYLKENCKQ